MVLGAIKNLDDALMRDILACAIPLSPDGVVPKLQPPFEWTFWPPWNGCEPDVVINDHTGKLLAIEVKLYSNFGRAEEVEQLQLAREWRDGLGLAGDKDFWLLALTNHASMPRATLEHQLGDQCNRARVLWLSWLEVGRSIRNAPDAIVGRWRKDLLDVLLRLGLAPFDGFDDLPASLRGSALAALAWA